MLFPILYQKMEEHTQTWWNKNAEARLDEFKDWVGDASAPSKVYMAEYVKKREDAGFIPCRTLLDAGCGTATFYDTLHQLHVGIAYTGVDTCAYFLRVGRERGVSMIDADIRKIPVVDGAFDVAFSRHTFEHQPNVESIMNELIRVGRYEMCHIFFIKPLAGAGQKEVINWDHTTNLYHNTYTQEGVESILRGNSKVNTWKWVDINDQECALHVYLKTA